MPVNLGGGRLFSHFTDANGVIGITALDGDGLEIGEQVIVTELSFAQGINSFLASEPGRIFVTLLGTDATNSQLMNIGVFGDTQKFVIERTPAKSEIIARDSFAT